MKKALLRDTLLCVIPTHQRKKEYTGCEISVRRIQDRKKSSCKVFSILLPRPLYDIKVIVSSVSSIYH